MLWEIHELAECCACSQLRIRCLHNHSTRRHSVITFLAVNLIKSPLSPKYCLNVSPYVTKRDAFCIGLQFMSHTHISCTHEITTCYDVARRLSTCENEPVALQSNKETLVWIMPLLIFKPRRLMDLRRLYWHGYLWLSNTSCVLVSVKPKTAVL